MSERTPIEWCDSACNPVMGCDGCELWMPERGVEHCYAGTLHKIRGGRPGYADEFLKPKTFAGRMAKAARWSDLRGKARPGKPWLDGLPRVIFVSDMGDALSRDVPFAFLRDEVIGAVRSEAGQRHIWMWLTKQPHRMAEFARWLERNSDEWGVDSPHADVLHPWPENLWAGTSITEARYKVRARHIKEVPAAVRFLSGEPLIEDVGALDLDGISLVIVGGESGPKARPFSVAWARSIQAQCRGAHVAFFCKQLGANVRTRNDDGLTGCDESDWPYLEELRDIEEDPDGNGSLGYQGAPVRVRLRDSHGGDWTEWPADLRMREFPTVQP